MSTVSIRLVAQDDVTNVMRGVALRTQQIAENNAQRIAQIERNKALKIKQINQTYVKDAERRAQMLRRLEQRTSNQIISIKEREALRIRHIQQRTAHQMRSAQTGRPSGMGIDPMGQIMSRTSFGGRLGQFAPMGAGAGAGAVAAGLGVGALITAGAAFVKGVQTTFDIVAGGLSTIAGDFVGAIREIGGGLSVKKIIQDQVNAERQAVTISASGLGDVSAAEIGRFATGLSSNSEFNRSQIMGMMAQYQKQTGNLREGMNEGLLEDISKASTVFRMDPSQAAGLYGQLQSAFPDLQGQALQDTIFSLIGQGAAGAVEFEDLPRMASTLAQAGTLAGDTSRNISTIGGIMQIAKPGIGSVEETATGVRNLITQMQSNANIRKRFGVEIEGGQITNFDQALSNMVVSAQDDPDALTGINERSRKVITAIGNKVSTEGTVDERRQRVEEEFEQMRRQTTNLEKMNSMFEEHTQTLDFTLKKMFNELSNAFGPEFSAIIKNDIMPAIQDAFGYLISNKDAIGQAVSDFAKSAIGIAKALPGMMGIFLEVISSAAKAIAGFLHSIGEIDDDTYDRTLSFSERAKALATGKDAKNVYRVGDEVGTNLGDVVGRSIYKDDWIPGSGIIKAVMGRTKEGFIKHIRSEGGIKVIGEDGKVRKMTDEEIAQIWEGQIENRKNKEGKVYDSATGTYKDKEKYEVGQDYQSPYDPRFEAIENFGSKANKTAEEINKLGSVVGQVTAKFNELNSTELPNTRNE